MHAIRRRASTILFTACFVVTGAWLAGIRILPALALLGSPTDAMTWTIAADEAERPLHADLSLPPSDTLRRDG